MDSKDNIPTEMPRTPPSIDIGDRGRKIMTGSNARFGILPSTRPLQLPKEQKDECEYTKSGEETLPAAGEWFNRQWRRYDKLINNYIDQDNDAVKRALCLAFARSALQDETTEQMLADLVFYMTNDMTSVCVDAVGKENVTNTRASLLLLLWSLPYRSLQNEIFGVFRDYCCRNTNNPAVSFRCAVGSTLSTIAEKIANPLADFVEQWL